MALLYLNSCVLIAAVRDNAQGHPEAIGILSGQDDLACSDLVRLEVLPKAVYHRHAAEARFYAAYFEAVAAWASLDEQLGMRALDVAQEFGLAAIDALHVAAAERVGADELVTLERPTSPLLRVTVLAVRTILPDDPDDEPVLA